jgi:hypothetical protein
MRSTVFWVVSLKGLVLRRTDWRYSNFDFDFDFDFDKNWQDMKHGYAIRKHGLRGPRLALLSSRGINNVRKTALLSVISILEKCYVYLCDGRNVKVLRQFICHAK